MKYASMPKSGVAAHVLLVDDNQNGLLARKSVLEEQGYVIITATNGEEAFEAFPKQNIRPDGHRFQDAQDEWHRTDSAVCGRCSRQLSHHSAFRLGRMRWAWMRSRPAPMSVISKGAHEIPNLLRSVARLLARKPPRKPPGLAKWR